MATKKFQKGEIIMREKSQGTEAYIIKKGSVEVSTTDEYGEKKVLAVLKEQGIFGEMSLIYGEARTARVVALENCVVSVLTRKMFFQLPETNPGVLAIKKIMKERLQNGEEEE